MSYNFPTFQEENHRGHIVGGWVNNGTWYYHVSKNKEEFGDYVSLLPAEATQIEKAIREDPDKGGTYWSDVDWRPGLFPTRGIVSARWYRMDPPGEEELAEMKRKKEENTFLVALPNEPIPSGFMWLVGHSDTGSNTIVIDIETFFRINESIRNDTHRFNTIRPAMGLVNEEKPSESSMGETYVESKP